MKQIKTIRGTSMLPWNTIAIKYIPNFTKYSICLIKEMGSWYFPKLPMCVVPLLSLVQAPCLPSALPPPSPTPLADRPWQIHPFHLWIWGSLASMHPSLHWPTRLTSSYECALWHIRDPRRPTQGTCNSQGVCQDCSPTELCYLW